MQALVYEGPRIMNIRNIDVPTLLRDEVLIQVECSGICGSELGGYLGINSLRRPPLVFGHEFSGTIVARGDAVTTLAPGQRVTANPLITCGSCAYCKRGLEQLCVHRKLMSAALPGSNAEFVKVPERFVHPLPLHVTFEQGALTEPTACAVHTVELAEVTPLHSILVIGMGPIGQLILQAMLVHGAKHLIAVDTNPHRLALAQSLGAHVIHPKEQNVTEEVQRITDGQGVDVSIDAVGSSLTRAQCVQSLRAGGRAVLVGLHEEESSLPINQMIRREIQVVGAFAYSSENFAAALQLIADGRMGFSEGVVKAPLEEGAYWYETLVGNATDIGQVTKVLLRPRGL